MESKDRLLSLQNKEKKKILDREKFVVWQALKNRSMSTISLFKNDNDFMELRQKYSKAFHKRFNEGYESYKKGDWS